MINKQMKKIKRNKDNGDNYPLLSSVLCPPNAKTSAQAAIKRRKEFFENITNKINENKHIPPTQQALHIFINFL